LYERILVSRLDFYFNQNAILNPLQSGFRKNRSTIDHIIRLQDNVLKDINNREHTLAVFLNFSKVFDMVCKNGLLHKLQEYGISGKIYKFVEVFLSDRKMQVWVGDALSEKVIMENGTPQGSIISPLKFNIMINDLPTPTDKDNHAAIFADNSSAWSSGKSLPKIRSNSQSYMDGVAKWSEDWGFKLSETKTTAVLFSKSPP